MECIRWGILGAGSIAHRFAAALERVEGAELVAISGRNAERLSAYAEKHRVDMGKCYASASDNGWKAHERLLLDDDVDAVYIALPHGLHATLELPGAVGRQGGAVREAGGSRRGAGG